MNIINNFSKKSNWALSIINDIIDMVIKMKVKYPYPRETKHKPNKVKTYGMMFENALNITNEYYRINNKAIIYKKPTPVQVVKVDYPDRKKAKITEAFYRTPSTTDYNGIYKGKYVDYEAKETTKTSFSFKHIFTHQVDHLRKTKEMGGICFVLIYYKVVNEIYLIDIDIFYKLFQESENGARKSISIEKAKEVGVLVNQGYTPPIDYLKAIDEYYLK